MITGIDVSHHNGTVDWTKVSEAGHSFAFVKATEGVGWTDPQFERNWNEMLSSDMLRGAYHFARVSEPLIQDAEREAEWFHGVVTSQGAAPLEAEDLRPVLDIEWDKRARSIKPPGVVAWCHAFLDRATQLFGVRPIIYTGRNFWRWKLARTSSLSMYPLWLVQYTSRKAPSPIPGWEWSIWQHTAKGTCPGVQGRVDLNRLSGGEEMINKLIVGNGLKPKRTTKVIDIDVKPWDRALCSVANWWRG